MHTLKLAMRVEGEESEKMFLYRHVYNINNIMLFDNSSRRQPSRVK